MEGARHSHIFQGPLYSTGCVKACHGYNFLECSMERAGHSFTFQHLSMEGARHGHIFQGPLNSIGCVKARVLSVHSFSGLQAKIVAEVTRRCFSVRRASTPS